MTVHELIEILTELPNQGAEVKLIVGNECSEIIDVWKNSKPVIIEGKRRD